jgi:filamentous hemagglutinin family protein
VAVGASATFTVWATANNVIAGDTGGSPSDDRRQYQIPANLYLINPAGVVFGPNAALGLVGGPVSTRQGTRLAAPAGTIDVAKLDVSNPSGRGHGSSIFVHSETLAINAARWMPTVIARPPGGEIVLQSAGRIVLRGGAAVQAESFGSCRGAALIVTTASGGSIMADAGQVFKESEGAGGAVGVIVASDMVLAGAGAQITAQSTGADDAGSVNVSANRLLMKNGAAISTEA